MEFLSLEIGISNVGAADQYFPRRRETKDKVLRFYVSSRRVRSDIAALEVASGNQSAFVLDFHMRLRSSQCIILVCVNSLERYFYVAFCY